MRQEEKKVEKKDDDNDINSLFINCVFTTDNENKRSQQVTWLGATGRQCHIITTEEKSDNSVKSSVTMGNDSTSSVLRHEDIIIKNDSSGTMTLYDTCVVSGMNTNIISIL